jgi:hypothetical protein
MAQVKKRERVVILNEAKDLANVCSDFVKSSLTLGMTP